MLKKVIKHIKHHDLIKTIRNKLYIKKNLYNSKVSDKDYLVGLGKINLGYKMNLDSPNSLNEKLNWYKLNYNTPLMKYVVDKINAKDYVRSKVSDDIVVKTIRIFDKVDDIDFTLLPQKFVIKGTNDSSSVTIVRNKNTIDTGAIIAKLKNGDLFCSQKKHPYIEKAYEGGKNKIIVEELIETPDNRAPWDYKFMCFNGEPKFLFVASDRDTNCCFDFFDIDFNHLNVKQSHPNSKKRINKPVNYEKMVEICRKLSKDFPHVRVDLYNVDGKIYFSELTFYHFAGLNKFVPKSWDYKFGEFWNIDKIDII